MKIAWFTPLHEKSAIGKNSECICEELQKHGSVEIFTFNQEHYVPTTAQVTKYDSHTFNINILNNYDYIVYNMGNYAGYHKEIWEVMRQYPGILILHDQIMQNFFSQITLNPAYGGNSKTGEIAYLEIMRNCYGEEGEIAGRAFYKSNFGNDKVRLWDSTTAFAYPILDPILHQATAVFTHASFFLDIIKNRFYGPTGYAYLPFFQKSNKKEWKLPAKLKRSSKKLVISTGMVHPYKRNDQVAKMLLENPSIAKSVNFVLIGDYGGKFGEYLYSLSQGALKGCLYLMGYQSEEVMETFLREADFCVNLRFPNSEICSKSLIEQMAAGKPVIVLDHGFYKEIPSDCVVKIQLENEIPQLADAFKYLIDKNDEGVEIGNNAQKFVHALCTPEVYTNRFLSFIDEIHPKISMDKVLNETININRMALSDLSFNQKNTGSLVDTIHLELSKVSGATSAKPIYHNVIGIWFGFPYLVDLRREGITRFLQYMLQALLEYFPIECEIWTYSINYDEIYQSFESLLNSNVYGNRVRVVTEQNYKERLSIPSAKFERSLNINATQDNLSYLVKQYSKARCFITAIVYLDNVIGTDKPIFVPVHDLGTHVYYDEFVIKDTLYKAHHVDIRSRAENLARSGAFMFSNSEHVRQEQVLKYISGITRERTNVVYLPVNIPINLEEKIQSEYDIRKKYKLLNPYIFYPTQVRPYKNVGLLIEALHILMDQNLDITLVLTGAPADVPEVEKAINNYQLQDKIICLSGVSEIELYSLYLYACMTVVPTLLEGGFPWQACEALLMNTPLVLSDIPVVRERIEFCGMTRENCGLELIDPHSAIECAAAITRVLENREKVLISQQPFSIKFLSYTWKDAATRYHQMLFESPGNSEAI